MSTNYPRRDQIAKLNAELNPQGLEVRRRPESREEARKRQLKLHQQLAAEVAEAKGDATCSE